jgi:hypothetical protein
VQPTCCAHREHHSDGVDASLAAIQVEGCTGGVSVLAGLPVGATLPDRSPNGVRRGPVLIAGPQHLLRLVKIMGRGRGASDCRLAVPLKRNRRLLQNTSAPKEQHERYERGDRK